MTLLLHSRLGSARKWALVVLVGSVGLGAMETVHAVPLYGARVPGESVFDSPSPVSLDSRYPGILCER